MNILNFILLTVAHYLLGWGILRICGLKNITYSIQFSLVSYILGQGLSCLFPVILEMTSIPITNTSLAIAIGLPAVIALVFWIPSLKQAPDFKIGPSYLKKIMLYDILFLIVLFSITYVAMFKNYYYPPTPRDLTSGPEAIAEFTVREHRINNSYFNVDLTSTDNHQKPPYLLGLQIIYKSFVQPFGQVWLSPLVLSFWLLLYTLARKAVHPVIAAIAVLLTIATPELFGYTIMPLFDVSNTIYVFIGFYYLFQFLKWEQSRYLWLSSFGFGLATLTRPETIFLVGFVCIAICIKEIVKRKKHFLKPALFTCLTLVSIPLVIDIFTMEIFVKHFIPAQLNIGNKLNTNFADLSPFFTRLSEIIHLLMYTDSANPKVVYQSSQLYSDTFDILLVFLVLEIGFSIFKRKLNQNATVWFTSIFLVFILLGFIGYLLPWTDFSSNSKRGLFKMIPLVFFFVIHSSPVQLLSESISRWERK